MQQNNKNHPAESTAFLEYLDSLHHHQYGQHQQQQQQGHFWEPRPVWGVPVWHPNSTVFEPKSPMCAPIPVPAVEAPPRPESPHPNPTPPSPIQRRFVHIDLPCPCTLHDLVLLLKSPPAPFDLEHEEYNIDISRLLSIREELETLDDMIGLSQFKDTVLNQLFYFMQGLHLGDPDGELKHTVLYGPPGTGKTVVAKLLGKMFSKLGVLTPVAENPIFKKVTRADLIAGYLGQTAAKTRKVMNECQGGVLFIDEAYALGDVKQGDAFSKECLDTLCEMMTDNKQSTMVIVAGYQKELQENFFATNPGLSSRFVWRYHLEGYTPTELHQMFMGKVHASGWTTATHGHGLNSTWFEKKKQ